MRPVRKRYFLKRPRKDLRQLVKKADAAAWVELVKTIREQGPEAAQFSNAEYSTWITHILSFNHRNLCGSMRKRKNLHNKIKIVIMVTRKMKMKKPE